MDLATGRTGYVHVIDGEVIVNGQPLAAGDGLTAREVATLELDGSGGHALVFDLP